MTENTDTKFPAQSAENVFFSLKKTIVHWHYKTIFLLLAIYVHLSHNVLLCYVRDGSLLNIPGILSNFIKLKYCS